MTGSGRSSGRVGEDSRNHLAIGQEAANRGADGRGLLARAHGLRTSQTALAEIGTSLADREWEIIHSLAQLHFLTTRQVERLHYPVGDFTPLAAARTARRHLTRLHDLGLVDRLERRVGGLRAGSASFVYRLSPLGARLLNHPTRRRSREPSLTHLTHVLAVSELVVRLHEHARDGGFELLDVQTEPDCWRPLTAAHGGRVLLKPDLRVTLGVGDQELHWFVEQDNNTEHRPVLARKCHVYLQAWRDGREQATAGVFPRILWVVPDQHRAEAIGTVIDHLAEAPAGMFVVATRDAAVAVMGGGGS